MSNLWKKIKKDREIIDSDTEKLNEIAEEDLKLIQKEKDELVKITKEDCKIFEEEIIK